VIRQRIPKSPPKARLAKIARVQPAEPTASLSELEMPLANLIRDTAHAAVEALGREQREVHVEGLATQWQRGTLVMQPGERSLKSKEVPLETFFHKIVMIRNNGSRADGERERPAFAEATACQAN
jgi:hypothetical protein